MADAEDFGQCLDQNLSDVPYSGMKIYGDERARKRVEPEPPGKLRWVAVGLLLCVLAGGTWFIATDPQARAAAEGLLAQAREATEPAPVAVVPQKPETRWTYKDDNGVLLFVKTRSDVPRKFRNSAREVAVE